MGEDETAGAAAAYAAGRANAAAITSAPQPARAAASRSGEVRELLLLLFPAAAATTVAKRCKSCRAAIIPVRRLGAQRVHPPDRSVRNTPAVLRGGAVPYTTRSCPDAYVDRRIE